MALALRSRRDEWIIALSDGPTRQEADLCWLSVVGRKSFTYVRTSRHRDARRAEDRGLMGAAAPMA